MSKVSHNERDAESIDDKKDISCVLGGVGVDGDFSLRVPSVIRLIRARCSCLMDEAVF